MKKNKNQFGNSNFTAFIVLLLLCTTIISFFYLVVNLKYLTSNKIKKYNELEKINNIINNIEKDFKKLTFDEYDSMFSNGLYYIKNKYSNFNIEIKDISSGININCIDKNILFSKDFEKLIFKQNRGKDNYQKLLENKKYFTNKDELTNCFNEFGLNNICFYGWINKNFLNNNLFELIKSKKERFPIVNSLPSLNVYFTDSKIIECFIKYDIFDIKEPEDKFNKLMYFINSKSELDKNIMSNILGVKENNKILDILGVKTQFWNIKIYTDNAIGNIIIGGFTESKDSTKISYYTIIERNIQYEPKSI